MTAQNRLEKRPEFMAILGLLPPYSEEEVKHAYRTKANAAHPDHGGDAERFHAVRDAYEQAQAYVRFHGDKRSWIADHVGQSLTQERIVRQLEALGAIVDTAIIDWLHSTVGDFAELTRATVDIRLQDSPADELIEIVAQDYRALHRLKSLNLSGCQVSDKDLAKLARLRSLERVDLSRTKLTSSVGMLLAERLPLLVSFDVQRTSVGWWTRRKIRRRLQRHATSSKFLLNPTAS